MLFDSDTSNELNQYLDKGERLVWSDKPKTGIIFSPFDIFLIPFSLFWCGFAIFWMAAASQASFIFAMFGLPFVLIGLMMVFGRFIFDAQHRKHTTYGLTNKRLIVKSGTFVKKVHSIDLVSMTNLEFVEKQDGSGTISWGIQTPFSSSYSGMNWWPGVKIPPSIALIADVRKVFNKIKSLQSSDDVGSSE